MSARLLAAIALAFSVGATYADWPGFRGDGSAVGIGKNLPVSVSADSMVYKIKLPGLGASSPVIVGDRLFLTYYTGYGDRLTTGLKGAGGLDKGKGKGEPGDQKNLKLGLACFERDSGKLLWKKEIQPTLPEAPFATFLKEHGYASSTPASDGKSLFVFFGKSGVFAFDLNGKELWRQSVGSGTHEWGSASSPALSKNAVIINAAIESKAIVALDKKTGKELWRKNGFPICWTSPVVVNLPNQKQEVVFHAPGTIHGFDPDSGAELWTCKGLGGGGISGSISSTPAVSGDTIYAMTSSPGVPATMVAVKAGGRGDVTDSHVLWKQKAGAGICSPVAKDGFVYFVDGSTNCLSTKDGSILYKERLYDGRGEYASAVLADGKIYALTRFTGLYVLETGEKFNKVAHNPFLDDTSIFNSTPALDGDRVFLRSNAYLYCIGKK